MASPSGIRAPGDPGAPSRTEVQKHISPSRAISTKDITLHSSDTISTTSPVQTNLTSATTINPSEPVTSPTEALSELSELPKIQAPLIPPYWRTHARTTSSASAFSLGKPAPIRLEDNTGSEEEAGIKSPLWARVVAIDGHVVVSGNMGGVGIGDYVVWTCRVGTVDGGSVQLHKRYSEFEALRTELASTFPRAGSSLPVLPPKSVFHRFRPAFLEKRRAGLEYFLSCVLLNPEFASSAVLKEFVFS